PTQDLTQNRPFYGKSQFRAPPGADGAEAPAGIPEGSAPPAGTDAPGRGGRAPGDTLPPGPRDLGSTGPRLPGHGDLNPGGPGRLRGPLRITGEAGMGLRAEGIGPISAHFQERPDSR